MSDKLLPCPFCGKAAEADSLRAYRNMSSGNLEHAAAVYCTACSADMTWCYRDTPELDRETVMASLIDQWNARPIAQEPAGQSEAGTSMESDGAMPSHETAGGFPVAAAPYQAEETGVLLPTRQGADAERRVARDVTAGETAPHPSITAGSASPGVTARPTEAADASLLLSEIVTHFAKTDEQPSDWAHTDDHSEFCLDHQSPDKTKFWLDLKTNGEIAVLWKPAGAPKPRTMSFVQKSAAHPTVKVSGDAEVTKMHDALNAANLEYSAYSCNGVNLFGDRKSIVAAQSAFHSHSEIDPLKTNLRHWRDECGKLHARLGSGDAAEMRDDPGCCPACGAASFVAGEPYWQHGDEKRWSAAASVTCDRCDHVWDIDLGIRALPLTAEGR